MKFDRFMVVVEISSNAKIGRLSDREFRCLIEGVWPLAAKAEPRGYLVVAGHPATAGDVARQAHCSTRAAAATLEKLRSLHMIERDDETGLERIHDWDENNPGPRLDVNATRRQALYRDADLRDTVRTRDRNRCRYCGVKVRWRDRRGTEGGTYDHVDPEGPNATWNLVVACRSCNSSKRNRTLAEADLSLLPEPTADLVQTNCKSTALSTKEVEVEEKKKGSRGSTALVSPFSSGRSAPDPEEEKASPEDRRLCRLLAEQARARNPKAKVKSPGRWLREMRLLRERDGNPPDETERLIRWLFSDPGKDAAFWADVIQSPANLREHYPKVWQKMATGTRMESVEDSAAFLARREKAA